MQKIITIILSLCFFQLASFAQSASEYNSGATNAYATGNYAKAKEYFELSLALADTPITNYNLANTCEKLGDIGAAKAYYMRAIYQDPRLKEALFNLETLDKKYALSSFNSSRADSFFSNLSANEWLVLAAIFLWFAIFLFVILPLLKIRNPWQFFLGTIFLALFILASFAISYWNTYANSAVALIDNAPLKLSPTQSSETASTAKQGQIFTTKKHKNDFALIENNGKKGWVSLKDKNFLFIK